MKKRKHWLVAAGLAVCGLMLAALTLSQPRSLPERGETFKIQPVVKVVPSWGGIQSASPDVW